MQNPIAVSSWALHRTIGVTYHDSPATGPKGEDWHESVGVPLLELPSELAKHGYNAMQLCHFHLPSRESGYVSELHAALKESSIQLHALLIDDGDISDPENSSRDEAWIAGWLSTAEDLGAIHARVIAGKQPYSGEAFERSASALRRLADGTTVRIETENWFDLTSTPKAVLELLDRLEGKLGLCADFGNWPRPRKYTDLPMIMPRAETCHAKLEFASTVALDEEDAAACLGIAKSANFTGAYVLVNGGPASEWDALDIQRQRIERA